MYLNYYISPDALGSTGNIHVASNAQLALGISQNAEYGASNITTTTFNKTISLDEGKLYFDDGRYSFTKTLQLTTDSEIQSEWDDKNHSFAGISGSNNKLTIRKLPPSILRAAAN